jgi:hypothetical protein
MTKGKLQMEGKKPEVQNQVVSLFKIRSGRKKIWSKNSVDFVSLCKRAEKVLKGSG